MTPFVRLGRLLFFGTIALGAGAAETLRLRVPALACWPGKIAPGRVSDHLGYFPDLLPTCAELAGAVSPKDIDGLSLVPELLGETPPDANNPGIAISIGPIHRGQSLDRPRLRLHPQRARLCCGVHEAARALSGSSTACLRGRATDGVMSRSADLA